MGSRKDSCQQLSVREIAFERGEGLRALVIPVLEGAIAGKPSKWTGPAISRTCESLYTDQKKKFSWVTEESDEGGKAIRIFCAHLQPRAQQRGAIFSVSASEMDLMLLSTAQWCLLVWICQIINVTTGGQIIYHVNYNVTKNNFKLPAKV